MTADTLASWAFGRHAPRLARAGYEPIPISLPGDHTYKDAGKQPAQRKGWSGGCPIEDWPRFANCGLGLLTRDLPTIDIDTLDQSIGDALQQLVDRHIGEAPVRYGMAPKRAMPFRLKGDRFGKLRITWRSITGTGDEGRPKEPGVEILADGQQFVALGIHPGTWEPYHWERHPDLMIPRALLPPLGEALAHRFIEVVRRFILDIGGELIGHRPEPKPVNVVHRPSWRPETSEAERIESALKQLGNDDLHYDDWIDVGLAIKASLGEAGFGLWRDWSAKSSKNIPRVTKAKWVTFKPTRITAGKIFYLLKGL